MTDTLDRLHAAARRQAPLLRLAIISRILLAIGFLPTGMVKLLGERFTQLPATHPVGAIFEAFYQTGAYWRFLGLGQVLAAILLLVPATATLGAVVFFPIMLNVTVLTWAVHFKGTTIVTTLMLLANLFLLCWDYDRWRGILFRVPAPPIVHPAHPLARLERIGYAAGTATAMVVLLGTRGLAPRDLVMAMLPVAALAALMVVVGWVQVARTR